MLSRVGHPIASPVVAVLVGAATLWTFATAPGAYAHQRERLAQVPTGCSSGGSVQVGGRDGGGDIQIGSDIASDCGDSAPGGVGTPGLAPPCAIGQVTVLPPNSSTCWIRAVVFDRVDPNVATSHWCVSYIDVVVGPPNPMQAQVDAYIRGSVSAMGWCPATPPPSMTANTFFTTRQLPSPTVQIQPGRAVVGMLAYMQIDAPTSETFLIDDGFGNAITITAGGRFHVDWGDGSPVQDVGSDHGGPYPDGDITHAYQQAGTVTVTVTESWSASWSSAGTLGKLAGTVPHRTTVGRLPNFAVHDVQANRDQ